ncbi:hypothetical protein SAMN02910339_00508 [Lachnospiraceae bacterium YSD2013]|nr:hypothetical protein SAMN02910339_00508 [Lachnospiraceae bacterium YSD2013]
MRDLLVLKEKIKRFVGKNDAFIMPILKFALTFLALLRINGQIGFRGKIASFPITLVVALAGSFLPLNLTLVILALIILVHLSALSLECAALVAALFLVMFLMYFRFSSKDSVAVVLTPLSFAFKIPYVIPVSMGLVGTPSSMVSVGCGAIVYHVLHYISGHKDEIGSFSIKDGDNAAKLTGIKGLVDGILNNKAMFVFVVSFAVTVLVVYLIRRLAIPYCWQIAIGVGAITCFLVTAVANGALHGGVSIGGAFVGAIVSIILNIILQYFCFDLDYNRTEKVQFEDDEYYYYVKAVPKNTIKIKEKAPSRPVEKKKSSLLKPARPASFKKPVKPRAEEPASESRARNAVRANAAHAANAARRTSQGQAPERRTPLE